MIKRISERLYHDSEFENVWHSSANTCNATNTFASNHSTKYRGSKTTKVPNISFQHFSHSYSFRVKLNQVQKTHHLCRLCQQPAPTYFHRQFFSPGSSATGGSRIYKSSIPPFPSGGGSPVRWISIARRLNPGETGLFRPRRNATPVASACPEVCFAPCSTTSFAVLRLVSPAFFRGVR